MQVVKENFLSRFNLTENQLKFIQAIISGDKNNVLYGGRGYIGKTRTLVICAVYLNGYLRAKGYTNIRGFFGCMTYPQIEDRIVPVFRELFSEIGEYAVTREHGAHFRFHDKTMGVICFRNLEDPDKRKGSGFAYILIDEITELPFEVFGTLQYLRLQRTEKKYPFMPLGAATNPDGIGHAWVKSLWVPGYQDFEVERNKQFVKSRFIYIHGQTEDNPAWTEEDFDAATAGLSESVRKGRKEGLWNTPEGARWPMLEPSKHQFNIARSFPDGIPDHWPKIIGIDYGLAAPYAALWFAIDQDRNAWCYREDYESRIEATMQAKRIRNLTKNENIVRIFADPAIFSRLPQHTGPSAVSIASIYYEEWNGWFKCGIERGFNKSRAIAMSTLDSMFNDNGRPNLYISDTCINFWGELTSAVWDTRGMLAGKKEDIDPRNADHAITASYYALHNFYQGAEVGTYSDDFQDAEHYMKLKRQEDYDSSEREFRSWQRPKSIFNRLRRS